ncbi:MAG: phosphatase PAP2 family protein [Chloroflexota bacterium]|nr:phosphatase PAP2 family protein [Chloroflexota bacterium]
MAIRHAARLEAKGIARIITEISAPFPMGSAALTVVTFHSSRSIDDALKWEGSTLLLVSFLPLIHLLRQMRHGKVTDYHFRQREQRLPVFAVFLVSWLVALLVLVWRGAPRELVALIGAGVIALVVMGTITAVWKISMHSGVVAGLTMVLALLFGVRVFVFVPFIPAIGWSRVRLGDHTPPQVVAGMVIGATVSGIAFTRILALLH